MLKKKKKTNNRCRWHFDRVIETKIEVIIRRPNQLKIRTISLKFNC